MDYKDFIKSREWQHIRRDALKLYGDACLGCGSYFGINLHHLIYRKNLFDTKPTDLAPLCFKCHDVIHSCGKISPITYNTSLIEVKRLEITTYLSNLNKSINNSSKESELWCKTHQKMIRSDLDFNQAKFDSIYKRKSRWEIIEMSKKAAEEKEYILNVKRLRNLRRMNRRHKSVKKR